MNYKIFGLSLVIFTFTLTENVNSFSLSTMDKIEQTLVTTVLRNCTKNSILLGITREKIEPKARLLLNTLYFVHHVRNTLVFYPFYKFHDRIMSLPKTEFDPDLPTVIILYGYFGSIMPFNCIQLAKVLRDTGKVNVFVLEQLIMMTQEYLTTIINTRVIGEAMGEILAKFYKNGVKKFHLIGYSLGVYTASYTGRTFEKLTSTKLDRISGIEGAGSCYNEMTPDERLRPSDAKFVDVMHTNTKLYGTYFAMGHVDFYPNGGRSQPMCKDESLCSHYLGVYYYLESVKHDHFWAVECSSWEHFKSGHCSNNTRANMGYWTDYSKRGIFYLKTDKFPPFAMKERGIVQPITNSVQNFNFI